MDSTMTREGFLFDIEPDDVPDAYERAGFAELTDAQVFERILSPWIENLKAIGIAAKARGSKAASKPTTITSSPINKKRTKFSTCSITLQNPKR